jgi:tetratricopeptide (TPR) repeat protein
MHRSLLPLALLGLLAFVPGDEPPSGFERFLTKQSDAAKAFGRKKDWAGAAEAWRRVLELDPVSIAALTGVADAVQAQGNKDLELQARYEQADALSRIVSAGQKDQQRALDKVLSRIAELDPQQGRTEALLVDYAAAQKDLAQTYEVAGLPASAILAWGRRARLVLPGSPAYVEAAQAIDRIKRTSPVYVAQRFDPGIVLPTRDEAWIAEQDKKSAKFSSSLKLETAHYRIKTNAGWRMLQAAAAAVERVNVFYREIWGVVPDPRPEKANPKLREMSIPFLDVNIFKTRDEYIHRAGEGKSDWSGGHYNGSAVETYDQGEGGGKNGIPSTMGVLFHECSHQFMDICVGDVPSFVNEGVASLFEGIELMPNGDVKRDLPVPHYLQPLAAALRDGSAKPMREIFNANANEPEQYKYRWGVFYFVRMFVAPDGSYPFRDRLVDYIYDFKKGDIGDKAAHFEEFFLKPAALPACQTFAEWEKVWTKWILELDEEQRAGDKRLADFRAKAQAALANDPAKALSFADRALDIDPEDGPSLAVVARACDVMQMRDRALATWRRVLDGLEEENPLRPEAKKRIAELDPVLGDAEEARKALAGGMAALARDYDEEGLPLAALRCSRQVLGVDPFEASARAMVTRLERDTGFSVQRWQRLCNGYDLRGWWGTDSKFFAPIEGGVTSGAAPAPGEKPQAPGSLVYQALLCTRQVLGDWSYEARIQTDADWRLVGLIFGAKDSTHYEAIALRKGQDGITRIDHGAYVAEAWSFPHTDGALKYPDADPTKGVMLRIEVRGRLVSVSLDGKPVQPFVGKQNVGAVKYPLAALRGDIGLLTSGGVTKFTDVRLLAGAQR